ncbi:hypothetical protein INR49_022418 [Caranx melampygus]|nr:hypothetical protein INR49_022418 [Caranx melampygus]
MVQYARSDTHYLLYIYDCMRVQLFDMSHGQTGLLQCVWNKSKDISLKKYLKPIFTEESYLELQRKQKKSFNTQQLTAFRLLFAWRDKLARQEDESTGYVLPTHMMSKISEELPKEPQGIIACCNPVPPLVRQQVNELHLLVQQAREMPLLKRSHCLVLMTPPRSLLAISPTFLLMELETKNDQESPSVAHMKARRIIESFENPFRMSIEQQQKELEAKRKAKEQAKEQAKKVAEERNKAKQSYQESLQNVATVRQQAAEAAKGGGKKRERVASEVGESTPNRVKS